MSDAFLSLWRIARTFGKPLHGDLPDNAFDIPHTVGFVVRMRETIDGFMELPKDKRPPEAMWFDGDELEEWFDRVFDRNKQTSFDLYIDEVEG